MMRIEFKRIEMLNFMAFKEEAFDFSKCSGMSLVQGKNNDSHEANGAGKSTLFSSLLYVLFGKLRGQIKNENLVNKYTKSKDMCLVLWFSVDNEDYKIRRGLTKGKATFLELLKIEDGKEVDLTKSTIQETQDFIERDILHCDISIFLRTMLLTAEQTYNFYMLKKGEKKEFVEKLFDISVFETMFKAIHKDVLTLEKDSIATQNRLMVLNKNHEEYEDRKNRSDESKEAKVKVITDEIDKLNKKLEEVKKLEDKSNPEVIKKLEDAIETLRDEQDTCADEIRSLESKESQIELGVHKIVESVSSRQKTIDKHKDILSKLCKDCQPVLMKHYSLDKMLVEIEDLDKKKTLLEESKRMISQKIAQSSKKFTDIRTKSTKAREKLKSLVEESTKASRALASVEMQLKEAQSNLKNILTTTNPYIELIEKCENDINDELSKSSKIEEKSKYLKFAEAIVSQDTLRKFIIKDLVVLLNNKIKTYLTKLGAKFYVQFDEDMDYEFIVPNGTYEWSNFSAGEKMRIMVATSFAFRDFMSIRNGLNSNVLIFDEYFDSAVDQQGIESILDILKEFSKTQDQNIFVVSHRLEVVPDQFDRVVLVEKTNDISHVKIL